MCDEPLASDNKLIALGLPAKDGPVLDHQAAPLAMRLPLEEQRCRQAADTTANHDAIKYFSSIDGLFKIWEATVTDAVTRRHDLECVAVRVTVVADASITVPIACCVLRQQV